MPAKRKRRKPPTRKAADTGDILGAPARSQGPARVPARWRKHHQRLVQLRNYLLARQNGRVQAAQEEMSAFSLHMADAATDSFDRDIALSRASSEQDAVYEIDEAIDRIHENTYGICELTGKQIEAERLEAIPWTRFSLEAEQTLEKEGTVQRARLAPRTAVQRGSGADGDSDTLEPEQE